MSIGPLVRRAFGRYERQISELYRAAFIDLDVLVASIQRSVPTPAEVLEVGCGEGAVTERLALAYPHSTLTGIDICQEPGRLYRGNRARVRFLRTSAEALRSAEKLQYELVVIADVLHHVPFPEWLHFLSSVAPLVADGGTLVLKDWVQKWTPAYAMGYLSDRFITGDRVRYPREGELRELARKVFGSSAIRSEFRIRPWHCNLALLISPQVTLKGRKID